ncbi:uncharacterized protein N0V89_007149 [Didymosphaeria variabile]|uniref:DUF1996 domain-containing protein n=1 Tax=Didymosphaeria variabile TaxID=1932322 RepID=A0A9W9C9W8_9PLEO|nr:uncharacterized protein N0V89_007149 [Didymosphaeria variabile]KAJ4351805.1 hypothetical protein N0V89_007149 [Didymosphaeria variabile]
MAPSKDMPGESTCTTCQFSEDFSNYWTAILYFRARNGTYKRVPQHSNAGFEGATGGGMTVYYMTDPLYNSQPKSKVTAFKPGFRMFVGDINARTKEDAARFRQLTYTCMTDAGSPYKKNRFEVIWDTSKFNDPADWPEDGSQPFVWSFGDPTGYANHADC